MKDPWDERRPRHCGHGALMTRGMKSRFSETKRRIKRWAKRVLRREAVVQSRDE